MKPYVPRKLGKPAKPKEEEPVPARETLSQSTAVKRKGDRQAVKDTYRDDVEVEAMEAMRDFAIATFRSRANGERVNPNDLRLARQIIVDLDEMKHGGVPVVKDDGPKVETVQLVIVDAAGDQIDLTPRTIYAGESSEEVLAELERNTKPKLKPSSQYWRPRNEKGQLVKLTDEDRALREQTKKERDERMKSLQFQRPPGMFRRNAI